MLKVDLSEYEAIRKTGYHSVEYLLNQLKDKDDDSNLISLVKKEGKINDISYHVETGIVIKKDDVLKVEFNDKYRE